MTEESVIQLKDVHKSYYDGTSNREVLCGTNVEFVPGEIIAVQGRSGSGKSTLLNLIAGIDLPDSGGIFIKGQGMQDMDDAGRTLFRRKHIGFVFQTFNLIPTLNVKENLGFPLELNAYDPAAVEQRVDELLKGFSLHDRAGDFPDQLSGGEQQRVAIARAIIHAPAIVLADEPTGNLDLETEKQVLEIIRALPGKYGVTVICATHSPEVTAIADRVYRLVEGQLTLNGATGPYRN